MPLVINSLGGGHTHTHKHTQVYRYSRTEAILRNQVCAGYRPARAWFKKPKIEKLRFSNFSGKTILHKSSLFLQESCMQDLLTVHVKLCISCKNFDNLARHTIKLSALLQDLARSLFTFLQVGLACQCTSTKLTHLA